jgi:signal transduction histidine kinase
MKAIKLLPALQYEEKCSEELIIVNNKLAFQTQENERCKAELVIVREELNKAERYQKEYVKNLEKMMFMISHQVRKSIVTISGISNLLDLEMNLPEKLKELLAYIKKSAGSLDAYTKELTIFTCVLIQKGKKIKVWYNNPKRRS